MQKGLYLILAAAAVVAAPASAAELVTNGNFSQGNTGFASDYVDRTNGPAGIVNGSYAIGTSAATVPNASGDWGGFGDHTTGTGNMLIADGALGRAWYQTVSLVAGTVYDWSFWAHTVQGNSGTPAQLSFRVDGLNIGGTLTTPASAASNWLQLSGVFTAVADGNVVLSIYNAEGGGPFNDFALDDISFASRAVTGGVPEPTTWALMMVGFGAIGFAMRRRSKVTARIRFA